MMTAIYLYRAEHAERSLMLNHWLMKAREAAAIEFPGYTLEQIERGLSVPVCEERRNSPIML